MCVELCLLLQWWFLGIVECKGWVALTAHQTTVWPSVTVFHPPAHPSPHHLPTSLESGLWHVLCTATANQEGQTKGLSSLGNCASYDQWSWSVG